MPWEDGVMKVADDVPADETFRRTLEEEAKRAQMHAGRLRNELRCWERIAAAAKVGLERLDRDAQQAEKAPSTEDGY